MSIIEIYNLIAALTASDLFKYNYEILQNYFVEVRKLLTVFHRPKFILNHYIIDMNLRDRFYRCKDILL